MGTPEIKHEKFEIFDNDGNEIIPGPNRETIHSAGLTVIPGEQEDNKAEAFIRDQGEGSSEQ